MVREIELKNGSHFDIGKSRFTISECHEGMSVFDTQTVLKSTWNKKKSERIPEDGRSPETRTSP